MSLDPFAPHTTTGAQHPATSHAAAANHRLRSGTTRYRVLLALTTCDLTDEEMQQSLAMSPNTQRPRRVELVADGLVESTPRRRRTSSGNWSMVWRASIAGRLAVRTHDQQVEAR